MYKLRQITHKLYIKSFGFEPQPGHTLEHEIGICCFSTKHPVLKGKSKDLIGSESGLLLWLACFMKINEAC